MMRARILVTIVVATFLQLATYGDLSELERLKSKLTYDELMEFNMRKLTVEPERITMAVDRNLGLYSTNSLQKW